jgi:hypothetical protein
LGSWRDAALDAGVGAGVADATTGVLEHAPTVVNAAQATIVDIAFITPLWA